MFGLSVRENLPFAEWHEFMK